MVPYFSVIIQRSSLWWSKMLDNKIALSCSIKWTCKIYYTTSVTDNLMSISSNVLSSLAKAIRNDCCYKWRSFQADFTAFPMFYFCHSYFLIMLHKQKLIYYENYCRVLYFYYFFLHLPFKSISFCHSVNDKSPANFISP